MSEGISIEELRWQDAEEWLAYRADVSDLRPLARAWLLHQRKSELVSIGLTPGERRVEALRAAATLLADADRIPTTFGKKRAVGDATIELAEGFTRWLETGER